MSIQPSCAFSPTYRSIAHQRIPTASRSWRLLYAHSATDRREGYDADTIARSWLTHRCSLVAVTRGERGATYYSRSAGQIEIASLPVVVADTVGAGDSSQAATLAWLAEHRCMAPSVLNSLTAEAIRKLGNFAASDDRGRDNSRGRYVSQV